MNKSRKLLLVIDLHFLSVQGGDVALLGFSRVTSSWRMLDDLELKVEVLFSN
jgi:hypothetical protein